MLRPILAFLTLSLAAFLLAPTVASVHERVNDLHFDRATPWEIFKWTNEPTPRLPIPDCGKNERKLYSEVTQWPARIEKDKAFTLRGVVQSEEDGREGVARIEVDLFLNATKEEPGIFLGKAETGSGGFFSLIATVPIEIKAARYHIVAHAKERQIDCNFYREHWSDPETDIISKTDIRWEPVEHAVAGRPYELHGQIVDSVGAPVANASLTVTALGKNKLVRTDDAGRFTIETTPAKEGVDSYSASYKGGSYYLASKNETTVDVAAEDFVLDDADEGLTFIRSTPRTLTGHVYVAPALRQPEMTLQFQGVFFATCPECPVENTIKVRLAEDGSFEVSLVVPPSEHPGVGLLTASGAGLKERYTTNTSVSVPTTLTLNGTGTGFFSKGFEATARLTDEAGRPVNGSILYRSPADVTTQATDANGTASFSGRASCGRYLTEASSPGSDHVLPSSAQKEVLVCGWIAFVPAWLLAIPLWLWPLGLMIGLGAWFLVRNLRQTYAPIIRAGPPLEIRFTEPADDAIGYAAVGEVVAAVALLEAPLAEGHQLRMGTSRETEEYRVGDDLRAHIRIVPDKLGAVPIRAEIVDPKGLVISRRTITLHVIHYGHEIERRYMALRERSGVTDDVTPREFEAWLRGRSPDLDPQITANLIRVFEEADYSPRDARRADFAAYLVAERLHADVSDKAEVARRATMA